MIRNFDTGYTRMLVSDGTGRFVAHVMPVGEYTVEASAAGFALALYEGVSLTVGETRTLNLILPLAPLNEQVTVSASVVDREETATGTSIVPRSVTDLPIRGRNFTEFVQLTPAIVQESDRSGLVISGQRSINSNVAIDGADFNDPLQGNQRGGNEAVFFFPQTAVREFQVVRSGASVEVGRTNAGFVNVVTKSGTNNWRGEFFHFNRNKALTSPDAFGRSLDNRQNQFGGSIGGPLKRDTAFLFVGLEQNFLHVPFAVNFQPQSAGVTVPAELLALEGEKHGTNNPTALFARSDLILSPRHAVNLHYMFTRMRGENFDFESAQVDEAETTNYARTGESNALKGALVSSLSSHMVNELRVQVATDNRSDVPNVFQPEIKISGFGKIGGNDGRPRVFDSTRYQVTDNLSVHSGAHELRFGFDLNFNRVRQQREPKIQGRYDFKSLKDFQNVKIRRYRQTLPTSNPDDLVFRGTQKELAVYAQDKVAFRRNLTLTAGLRWEGQWNPQPPRPNPAIPETALIPNDLGQWQPRLGLAWDVGANGQTIIRLSTGLYYARTPATLFQRVFTDNGLTTAAVDSKVDKNVLDFLEFPGSLTLLPPGIKVKPPRVFGFDPNFQNPRSFQSAVTIERVVRENVILSGSYVHNRTTHLQRRVDRNLFPPTIDATGLPIFPKTRPDPTIGRLSINESSASSSYDAFVLTLTARSFGGRAYLDANYTLARNMDDDSNERNFSKEFALNPFDFSVEKSYSKQDVRHNFNVSGVVDLPRGFMVSAILITRSAFPYTPVIGFDIQNDDNDDNDRAIINGRVAARNSFRQPAFLNLDLRVLKSFPVGEAQLDLIAEVYNVTRASNRHFGPDSWSEFGTPTDPVATAGQPLYAPSTARFGGPRQVQLGARVRF